jgi:CTD small phosphatase-like protein 2
MISYQDILRKESKKMQTRENCIPLVRSESQKKIAEKDSDFCINNQKKKEFQNFFESIFQENDDEIMRSFSVVASFPKISPPKKIKLAHPEHKKSPKTLFLDLDETLIHCYDPTLYLTYRKNGARLENSIQIFWTCNKEKLENKIFVRPFCRQLLQELSKYYEIVIYTASIKEYANTVLAILDPNKKYVDHILYREHCHEINGHYLKDLRIIKNRRLKDMILVDNTIAALFLQLENGIFIPGYYGKPDDKILIKLCDFLKFASQEDNSMHFLENYVKFKKMHEIFLNANKEKE